MDTKGRKNRCKARTKAGEPCQAAATAGGLCFFHANPNKASELGRIGGRGKLSSVAESADPLPKLETATAMREAVAQLITDVKAGKIHPRVAASLAPLMNLQLRLIETTNLERRVAKLEEKTLADAENGLKPERDVGDPRVPPNLREGLGGNGDAHAKANGGSDWALDPKP
jgi:hypothetical protein